MPDDNLLNMIDALEHQETICDIPEEKPWWFHEKLAFTAEWFEFGEVEEESIGLGFSYTTQNIEELWFLYKPALEFGGVVNTEFSDHISNAYIGFNWDFFITDDLFVSADLGIMYHNGDLFSDDRKDYGSHFLFREQIGLGYNVYENCKVRYELIANVGHASHASIFGEQNPGMNFINAGLQIRFK